MATLKHALPAPPGLAGDPHAFEIARVWAAHGKQVVAMSVDGEMDPAGWGLMLVDLARHAARAYAQVGRCPAPVALDRIIEGLHMELEHPTDPGAGALQ